MFKTSSSTFPHPLWDPESNTHWRDIILRQRNKGLLNKCIMGSVASSVLEIFFKSPTKSPSNPSQSPYIPMKFYEIPMKSHDFSQGVRRAALPPSLRRWRSGSVAGDHVSQRHPSLLSRGRGVIPFKVGKVLGDFIRYIWCCLNSGNYP